MMTSNAEDQANPPAAATLEPPKATKRANVTPQKRRVAPTKLKMCKAARTAVRCPKAKRLPNRPRPDAGCPRGQQGGQGLGLVEAARWRFTERGHENHGLVGGFCPRISERYCCPENQLKLVSPKSEDVERRYSP